jgi:putative transposase
MTTGSVPLLTRDELERRRLEGAHELLSGLSQSQVASKFGVSRTTASRWRRTLDARGMEALRKRKATGRPTRLSQEKLAELAEIFGSGPEAAGFTARRWTTRLFAVAIEARFGVRYDPAHVGRLIHKLGLRHCEPPPDYAHYAASVYSPNTDLSLSEISPTVA